MAAVGKNWMWCTVGLTLLVGVSLGLVGDRLIFQEVVVLATPAPNTTPIWFVCGEGSLDTEDQPGYLYPERFRKRLLKDLSVELSLSQQQQDELDEMLKGLRAGAREFWEDFRHAYCDVRDRFRSDIRELLEVEQQQTFDEMTERLDRRAGEWAAKRAAERK